MRDTSLVSVIMNAHNAEAYLEEAIESVLNQTYINWEIIFWDNNSSDSTGKIVSTFRDNRIKYYFSDSYSTLGDARNRALGKASGNFIAFLDCDDIWLPEKLEKQIAVFNRDQDIGLVYSDCIYFNSEGDQAHLFNLKQPYRGLCYSEMLNKYCMSLESVVIRKECLFDFDVWFDPDYEVIEEYDFFVRISEKWKVDYVEEALSKWRMHEASWTWSKPELFIDERKLMLTKIEARSDLLKNFPDAVQTFRGLVRRSEVIFLWRNKQTKNARALMLHHISSIRDFFLFFATFVPYTWVLYLKSKLTNRTVMPK
ncbi:MAG: glycosyl transferase family 2 [Gammaproteobacteria bacterium]|nr:glycosyl transferase family 2 [Gammaproteobacteria bacterium]|tara:strand:- start:3414 stop:4349 length:936 start_codon:yes stop_codon:yes gene_type:complete